MAQTRGRGEVDAFFAAAPGKLMNVLRGAARAGAAVVSDEIELRTSSEAVRANLRTRTKRGDGEIRVAIDVKPGWARSLAIWLEYGTSPHFISVDDAQRGGRGIGRINKQLADNDGDHSLVINGNFIGTTVFHPGARPYPSFRPALDAKEGEAIAEAQRYIDGRVGRHGISDVGNVGEE